MSHDGYEEIKDPGPSSNDRRIDTATRAVTSAVKTMTETNRHAYFGIYQGGAEACGGAIGGLGFKSHDDENVAHQVVEGLEVVDEPATLEASQSMIYDGITHVCEAWNLFTEAGQAQVVNPICSFFNGVAQSCLAQNKQASKDEKEPLQQTKKPLYDAESFEPMHRDDDADKVKQDDDKTNKM
jgi:hypothetical protein